MKTKKLELIILVSILALAAFLRLYYLGLSAIWADEALSANLLGQNFLNLWKSTFETANNPTYIYGLKLWSMFTGTSVYALRLFSVIFSLLSIIYIYLIGRKLFGKPAGLWSAFLLAVSYADIFYANQARPYTLAIFLVLISYHYFLKIIIPDKSLSFKKTRIQIFLYVLFTVLGLYTHPWFFFVLAAQFISTFIVYPKLLKELFLYQLLIVVSALPLLNELLKLIAVASNSWITKPNFLTLIKTIDFFSFGAIAIFFCLILFILLSEYFSKKNEKKNMIIEKEVEGGNLIISFSLFVIPIFLAFCISLNFPMYHPGHHEAVALPGFILVLAYIFSRVQNKFIILIMIGVLSYSITSTVIQEKQVISKFESNQYHAAKWLAEMLESKDMVIYNSVARHTFNYYMPNLREENFSKTYFPYYTDDQNNQFINGEFPEKSYSYVAAEIERIYPEKIWIVYDSKNHLDLEFVSRITQRGYHRVSYRYFTRNGIKSRINFNFPMFFDYIALYQR